MKKPLLIGVIVLLLLIIFFWLRPANNSLPVQLIKEEVTLYRVALQGVETDRVYLQVPFTAESEVVRYINVGLDLNHNGVIEVEQDEWLVQNMPAIITAGENARFPAQLADRTVGQGDPVAVTFFYSTEPLTAAVVEERVTTVEFTSEQAVVTALQIDDMDAVLQVDEEGNKRTGPSEGESLLRPVIALPVAYAQTGRPEFYSARHEGVPDQDQEYNECSPTAVANSFTWLAKTYGFEKLMPEDIGSTIDELKADLMWDSGTNDEDIIPGKQMFVDRHQLPIEVHQIGEQNDPDIHYKIYEEMKRGQAVEVSLQFYTRDANGEKKKAGGHMVTVTGVSGGPDFKGIRFSDSATDSGESEASGDLYSLGEGNKLNWFWTDKEVEIEYAYAQSPIQSVLDGTWSVPSGQDFLVGENHVLNPGGDVVSKGISRFGFFNSFIDHPGDHFVGDRFTVVTTVVRRADERQYMFYTDDEGKSQAYWHSAGTPWTLEGTITGGGPLSPNQLVGRPTKTTVSGDRYRVEQEFTCVQPGLAKVSYQAAVTWQVEDSGVLPADTRTRYAEQLKPEATFTIDSPIFRCLTTDASLIREESHTSVNEPVESACAGLIEDPDGVEVEVLKIDDQCFPKIQFSRGSAADPCQALHWHGGKVFSLTGTEREDPNPDACGFGKIGEVPEAVVKIDQATAAKYLGDIFGDNENEHEAVEFEYVDTDFDYKGYADGWQYGDLKVEVEVEGE